MAIIGIQTDRHNPEFMIDDFVFWLPQFKNYLHTAEGIETFNRIRDIVNTKIFKSIYGGDWTLAMSYGIAHYLTLIAQQIQAPSGTTLETVAGGGQYHGVLTSASVGGFSKSYDKSLTFSDSEESLFWNQTSYGASLMALLKTKPVASIFVVTNGPIEGAD